MHRRCSQFLAASLAGNHVQLRATLAAPGWSWPDFLAAATAEALLPALHSRFTELNLLDSLPMEVAEFLLAVESGNRERNAAVLEELGHAVALLNQAGIEPVLLKGAAYLTAGVYPDPATRYLCDIDLLLPESQLPDAISALAANGYRAETGSDPFVEFRHHHAPLSRPGRAPIELHYAVSLGKSARILPAGEIAARSRPTQLAGGSTGLHVRIPSPEHLTTHLILHSQMHHSYDQRIWPPLRAMADLAALDAHFGPEIDWHSIEWRFHRAGEHGALVLHLMQICSTLGMASPIAPDPAALTRFRWTRRRILRRAPAIRYFDPVYMFSAILPRRILMLRNLLSSRAGWNHLATRILQAHIYQRLFADIVEGRGR